MEISNEIKELLDAEIEKEVERKIREFPVRVKIDGVQVDQDSREIVGGEMLIEISVS